MDVNCNAFVNISKDGNIRIGGDIVLNEKKLNELTQSLVCEPDDFMHAFRKNVDLYLRQKGLTLAELSEEADMPLSTLRSFLYGDAKDCYVSMAVKLARALHVSVDELLGCGTISEKTRGSLQIMRQFPESFANFIHWGIRYHYDEMHRGHVDHAIEVMEAVCTENGNIKMTNDFHFLDISNLDKELHPKIFMGIRMPCDNYIPHYYEGDVLLIAHDREPRPSEHVVVHFRDCIWILQRKSQIINGVKQSCFYSIRDGAYRVPDQDKSLIIGYVAKVIRTRN